jgi:hypothetical protein
MRCGDQRKSQQDTQQPFHLIHSLNKLSLSLALRPRPNQIRTVPPLGFRINGFIAEVYNKDRLTLGARIQIAPARYERLRPVLFASFSKRFFKPGSTRTVKGCRGHGFHTNFLNVYRIAQDTLACTDRNMTSPQNSRAVAARKALKNL